MVTERLSFILFDLLSGGTQERSCDFGKPTGIGYHHKRFVSNVVDRHFRMGTVHIFDEEEILVIQPDGIFTGSSFDDRYQDEVQLMVFQFFSKGA